MAKGVFDHLRDPNPAKQFTVGIVDDVTYLSIDYDRSFSTEPSDVYRALFYGLGSDGTVGANKNTCKIIGEAGGRFAQGYFVYDSKKAGAVTVSHLRFGPRPIRSTYLVTSANFIACHQPQFVERVDMLKDLAQGGVFLLNAASDFVLPYHFAERLAAKQARVFAIDASRVARECGLGNRINTIMQVCFFATAEVMPIEEALEDIRDTIRKTYAKKGEKVVAMNLRAVDAAIENLRTIVLSDTEAQTRMSVPQKESQCGTDTLVCAEFVGDVVIPIIEGRGEDLPVSAMPCDGTFPSGTARYEKRNLATEIPVWDAVSCIQCGKCAMVCPHAAIRIKAYDESLLANAPPTLKSLKPMHKDWAGLAYTIQVAPEDCTGCTICVDVCPAKSKSIPDQKSLHMHPQPPLRDAERENWNWFLELPELDRSKLNPSLIRHQQLQQPLFEFSGACAGCGETPYVKLLTQLFGDRLVVANATGCSSIYGGNLPTTPWSANREGRGPAWANSLFEDNAEFGLGFRVSIDKQRGFAIELLKSLAPAVGLNLATPIIDATQRDDAEIFEQRKRVELLKIALRRLELKTRMHKLDPTDEQQLLALADLLVKKSVWVLGGDGWAYDIGFGGLDHVLASGRNVKVLVLDTEVYSNTGGQMSKSTPRAAVAKFAAGGKAGKKKDLGLIAMTYGHVYVASVARGARDEHTLKSFIEAEAYDGPSLIIAYSSCVAHGYDLGTSLQHQKALVESGQWLLYRYNPDRVAKGENPLSLDSRALKLPVEKFLRMENRFNQLLKNDTEESRHVIAAAQHDVDARWKMYSYLGEVRVPDVGENPSRADVAFRPEE